MTQTKPIKASLGFTNASANDVLVRGKAVLAGMYADKDDYPNPPVDEATLKSQLDSLSEKISAALDGGRTAIAAREHQRGVVVKSLRHLGQYAEQSCKDDMTIFLKSSFLPVSTTRSTSKPVSQWFRKIAAGKNSGQMDVALVAQPDALSYLLRWAAVSPDGTTANWTEQPIGRIKPPAVVSGLTPGTTYVFQVRSVTNSGYSDWSESVTRICT